MKRQAHPPRLSGSAGKPQAIYEKPRQFRDDWAEAMEPLPGQILRPLFDARNPKLSRRRREVRLNHARQELHIYIGGMREWFASVDAMMDNRGVEYVDQSNQLEADAFVERLTDSGRKALEKRTRVETAIAYAEMTIEWVTWELAHGH